MLETKRFYVGAYLKYILELTQAQLINHFSTGGIRIRPGLRYKRGSFFDFIFLSNHLLFLNLSLLYLAWEVPPVPKFSFTFLQSCYSRTSINYTFSHPDAEKKGLKQHAYVGEGAGARTVIQQDQKLRSPSTWIQIPV